MSSIDDGALLTFRWVYVDFIALGGYEVCAFVRFFHLFDKESATTINDRTELLAETVQH